jgi:hypothetical protein
VLHELLQWQPISELPTECPSARRPATIPQACGDYWTCLPQLCEFQVVDSMVTEGKPLTKPQHAQMLTGYGPAETGEISNSGRRGVPEGMTIYEHMRTVRPEIRTVHIAGLKFVGRGVTRFALENGSLDLFMRRGGRDGYTGVGTSDQVELALDTYLTTPDPFFLFVHYKAADVVAHRAGDGSPQYREAIISIDNELGSVIQHLEDRGMLAGTKFYITTDHGFNGNLHVDPMVPQVVETWLAARDHDIVGPATMLDVTPTILDAFGIDVNLFDPPYRGHSLLVP